MIFLSNLVQFRVITRMMRWLAQWSGFGIVLFAGYFAEGVEFSWNESVPGVAMTAVTNPGPVIYTVVRVDLGRLNKDLFLTSTLASNTVAGVESLLGQVNALPKELGTPVAAINGDFFTMRGPARGDPRGLHIFRGELVSVPAGPAAFWQDSQGKLHGESVISKLTVTWPGGGANVAGLNEAMETNAMVLFTPRMGALNQERASTSRRVSNSTTHMVIRPPGGREWVLDHSGSGPWLPLRVGNSYQAIARSSSDGFTNVPRGKILLSLSSNFLARVPPITNGTPVTIVVATDPDLTGVETALGSGPMLVREGEVSEATARMSETMQPRSAIGWNERYLYFSVADGRQPGISIGIRLSEMADFLIGLGCEEGINMDGGQSTTLMFNGATINHPVQRRDREIANALVVVRKPALEVNADPAPQK